MALDAAAVIAAELGVKSWQVQAAVELLDGGNTVPFIARYRKEATGELKDEQLRTVEERLQYLRNLEQRREEILRSISEQEKLTEDLQAKIEGAVKLQELEDLYLPYRPKKRTRASVARDRGLEPLAAILLEPKADVATAEEAALPFVTDEVASPEDALQGAMDIIAEDISDRADVRTVLRDRLWQEGVLATELVGEDEELRKLYLHYDNNEEPVKRMPSHRILAVNRAEKAGALKVTLKAPEEAYVAAIIKLMPQPAAVFAPYVADAVRDSYKRLLFPALERELRKTMTEQAEEQAIAVFGTNLKNLLMQPPLAGHVIMGLDPGYRMGCKMAVIDAQGNVLDQGIYHLTSGQAGIDRARRDMADCIRRNGVTLLSIGNGTASYETEQFVSELIETEKLACHYIITNEAGASVYSASKLAIEELPDLDVSIRGAVSIARRVQDPLAESVKIDPKSIGVGQYQHDVNQKQLSAALDRVVETVVNHVGVELNTASPAILQHIAGISATVAGNIVAYRKEIGTFTSRKELLKVKRLGPAAFTQCAGFLRLKDGVDPLDNTSVHPESYGIAKAIIEKLGFQLADLRDKERHASLQLKLQDIKPEVLAQELGAGVPTVRDIMDALAKPGRDPREDLPAPMTRSSIMKLEDIKVGTVVKGTVHNVVDFGAFVDFGLKVNGLLHRSEFCRRQEHPSDKLAVGDIIEAMIISVEPERNRIGLSIKALKGQAKSDVANDRQGTTHRNARNDNQAGQRGNRQGNRRGEQRHGRTVNTGNRRDRRNDDGLHFGNNNIRITYSKKS